MKIKIQECAKELRKWSLYRLAKEMGVPQQTIYSWASGRTQPSYASLDKLCTIIGCNISDLLENEKIDTEVKTNINKI